MLVVFYFVINCQTWTIYSFLQTMWRSRQVPESWHCKLKVQFQLQYPWLELLYFNLIVYKFNVSFPVLETINSETGICETSSALLSITIQQVRNLQWHTVLIWHFKGVCILTKKLVHILLCISKHCWWSTFWPLHNI